jgi:hypothetical protein
MFALAVLLPACDPVDPGAPLDGTALESGADDPLWDLDTLPIFRLSLPSDWAAQMEALIPGDGEWCEPRQTIRGSLDFENPQSGQSEHYDDVDVRYRGHSALTAGQRWGIKLAFDNVDADARFHELKHVNLQGTEGDASLMREFIALRWHRQAGVPAPRVGHARVYINDEYQGVFPNSEEADDQAFLDHHFDDASGHLYKSEGYCGGGADFEYRDDDPDSYDQRYEPKAGTVTDDLAEDMVPFLVCLGAAGSDVDAVHACAEQWIDVDEWLAEMAVDALMPDVDGLAGAGQNVMFYSDPSTKKFVAYPWDKDQAYSTDNLETPDIFTFHPPWQDPPVFTTQLRQARADDYCATLSALAGDHTPSALAAEIEERRAFLSPYMRTDPYFEGQQWDSYATGLDDDYASHHDDVASQAEDCNP